MSQVTLVDYGLGNLHSVINALTHVGVTVKIAEAGDAILAADRLILPGVGAFADGMAGLTRREQLAPLRAVSQRGTPLMGICLGMQLLFDESEEFGLHQGLGIIPGRVARIPVDGVKVPHVGWNRLQVPEGISWSATPLTQTPIGTWAYFVHSFRAEVRDKAHLLSTCSYGPYTIAAAVRHGSTFGLQYHPEKSGPAGLEMLKTFCSL